MKRVYKAASELFAANAVLSAPAGAESCSGILRCGTHYPEKKEVNAEGGALSGTEERRLYRGDFS